MVLPECALCMHVDNLFKQVTKLHEYAIYVASAAHCNAIIAPDIQCEPATDAGCSNFSRSHVSLHIEVYASTTLIAINDTT